MLIHYQWKFLGYIYVISFASGKKVWIPSFTRMDEGRLFREKKFCNKNGKNFCWTQHFWQFYVRFITYSKITYTYLANENTFVGISNILKGSTNTLIYWLCFQLSFKVLYLCHENHLDLRTKRLIFHTWSTFKLLIMALMQDCFALGNFSCSV